MPITPEEARKINDARPEDVAKVDPARPFVVKQTVDSELRFTDAITCLSQAIYYEAGFEPEAGQRAVAQVILNRVRHPAFPRTICGVVYQGSERVTGCQFTFTCDGSLARPPVPWAYTRAQRVARQALAGTVEKTVGSAVNYHADYVVPYWASSLNKITKIGAHIFYGLKGAAGSRGAFLQRYDLAAEYLPGTTSTPLPAELVNEAIANTLGTGGGLSAPATAPLRADESAGKLIVGSAGSGALEQPTGLLVDQARSDLVTKGSELKPGAGGLTAPKQPAPAPT